MMSARETPPVEALTPYPNHVSWALRSLLLGLLSGGASNSALRAIAVYGGPGDGVFSLSSGFTIEGCHIGLRIGSAVAGNAGDGVVVLGGGTVGQSCAALSGCGGRPNVIVGSGGDGIRVGEAFPSLAA
jgi:hypothetical protein